MRIYFLSCTPAILKLNGDYAGNVDLFERYVEVDLKDNLLAEVVPGDNLQPVNFFLNADLLFSPPDFIDVYLTGGDAVIHIRRFASRDTRLSVIFQTRFEGNLITLFSQGEVYLCIEGSDYSLTPVGNRFKSVRTEQKTLNGYPVLALYGGDGLVVISHTGTQLFTNEVVFAEFGATLKVGVKFETCTSAEAHCEYSYDGEKLTLISSNTVEKQPISEGIMHFAFFESVMTFGNFAAYLSPELAPKAADLRDYLGGFTGVVVPNEKFCLAHPNELAAGLVYPQKQNLYEIKYFAVQLVNGKIDNIYPVGE